MIDLAVLPYFLLTVALVVAIPGPNTIYVSTTSVNHCLLYTSDAADDNTAV